jgi:hypothetical protein
MAASPITAAMPRVAMTIPMQHIPRVRPPPFRKGEPREDQLPQPEGRVPAGQVWVQGRWRSPVSNAAKQKAKVQSQKIAKAIQQQAHGCNIYAYINIKTKQVVYSTTRNMQVRSFPDRDVDDSLTDFF